MVNNFRFPGQYYDKETGLHYNWNRYYDPETGRYISPDPIGLAGGNSLYGYAGADPVNFVDPDGEFAITGTLLAIWGITELAMSAYDLYDAYVTLADHDSGTLDKSIAVGGVFLGAVLPGGGYGTGLKTTKRLVSSADEIVNAPKKPLSRRAAFREAKEKGGIPRSQQPTKTYTERLTDQPGNVQSRVYEYKRSDGSVVTVREHSLGHTQGNHPSHFNTEVRPPDRGPRQPLQGGADSHTYFGN